jgi:Zn-dependent protease with chaperone function
MDCFASLAMTGRNARADRTDGNGPMTEELDTPQPQDPRAVYYDGTSNNKRSVTLRFGEGLQIVEDGTVVVAWPYADVRRADGKKALRLMCTSALPLARLEIADAQASAEIVARFPQLEAGRGATQTGRIVAWSLAAAASIVLVIVFGIPLIADRLAPLVPYAVEKRIGEAVDRQARAIFGGQNCTRPAGQAAFTKMVNKLKEAGRFDGPLEAHVLSSDIANAYALPSGTVYLLDGLLQSARNPDEVAGVLAHELGHAQNRDGLRKLIQTGGSSFLIGLLFGDVTGGGAVLLATRMMVDASYSREAESRADGFAIETMNGLGRSPRPLGEFLVRITGGGRRATVIDSHPLSADRLDRMKKEDRGETGAPILTEQEWQALKGICADVKKDDGKKSERFIGRR